MTWEELCKKIDPDNVGASGEWIEFGKITFYNDGSLEVYFEDDVMAIAEDRTPEQMYQIMEALK
jgi:CRISPR/Cas system CMR-associated protein Cmr3 (group 5 of RAMP superfamily)